MIYVKKRDGSVVEYDSDRIRQAVCKALEAINAECGSIPEDVVADVEKVFSEEHVCASVEDIQDAVEKALMQYNPEAAKAYILYREQHTKLRKDEQVLLDVQKLIDEYLNHEDWRVNENSNAGYSYASLINHISGAMLARYTLKNLYPREIANAHINGDLHIHDLSAGIVGYCAGWSLRDILLKGFVGGTGRPASKPAKHLDSALLQLYNYLCTLQTEWAGAQAVNSFDTLLAPFVREDGLDEKEVKQKIQQFVFGLNSGVRLGQCPFTNVSFDWTVPEDMKDQPVIIGGEFQDHTYSEYEKEMGMLNKAFLEVMLEGDGNGRIFSFPIPTYNITKDFNWNAGEDSNEALLFKVTGKYGTPYFQNFVNSSLNPQDVRSMCCRLQINLKELRTKTGGLFGAGDKTGSIGVVTINMPRLGYTSKNKAGEPNYEKFYKQLTRLMVLAKNSLELKRKEVWKNYQRDLMPYTKCYLPNLNSHFSTIGLVGMNECCINLFGKDITTDEGQKFAKEVLTFMNERLKEFQEETGHIYNLEASPAEATSYRLARIDVKKYPDIKTAGTDVPYYTNSTQLPVGYTDDLFEALDLQDDLQALYTGGTVFHGYIGESIDDWHVVRDLIHTIASKYKLPYFDLTPTFSICPVHGYIKGYHPTCPCCE